MYENTNYRRSEWDVMGIAPNKVIAKSEFEVHRQIYTEWM